MQSKHVLALRVDRAGETEHTFSCVAPRAVAVALLNASGVCRNESVETINADGVAPRAKVASPVNVEALRYGAKKNAVASLPRRKNVHE